jgi:hypothetical protein
MPFALLATTNFVANIINMLATTIMPSLLVIESYLYKTIVLVTTFINTLGTTLLSSLIAIL